MFLTTHEIVNDWIDGGVGVAQPVWDHGEVGDILVVHLDADKSEKKEC